MIESILANSYDAIRVHWTTCGVNIGLPKIYTGFKNCFLLYTDLNVISTRYM